MQLSYIINIIVDTLGVKEDVCKLKKLRGIGFMLLMDNKVKTGGFLDSLKKREKITLTWKVLLFNALAVMFGQQEGQAWYMLFPKISLICLMKLKRIGQVK